MFKMYRLQYKIRIFQGVLFGKFLMECGFLRRKYGLGEFHKVVVDGKTNQFGTVFKIEL